MSATHFTAPAPPTAQTPPPQTETLRSFLDRDIPPPEELGWHLQSGQLVFLYGGSNVAKTWLAMELARQVSESGRPVIYFAQEGHPRYLQRRFSWMLRPELPVRVAVRQPLSLVHGHGHADAIIDQCLERGTKLLVLDPLMDCIGDLDLNDGPSADGLKKVLLRIRDETDACVMVVHHSNKFGSRGGKHDAGTALENMLGHSSLRNAADLMVEVRRAGEENYSTVDVPKNRNGPQEFGGRLELYRNDGDGSMGVTFLPGKAGQEKTEEERKAKKETKKEKTAEATADRDGDVLDTLRHDGDDRSAGWLATKLKRAEKTVRASLLRLAERDLVRQDRGQWHVV